MSSINEICPMNRRSMHKAVFENFIDFIKSGEFVGNVSLQSLHKEKYCCINVNMWTAIQSGRMWL